LTPSALECEPTSATTAGRRTPGSRHSLFGTDRECALAASNTGRSSSVSTNTWRSSQSWGWKLVENWSKTE
jgi:hypothetical protein